MENKLNYIITSAIGYTKEDIAPFLKSASQTSADKILIFSPDSLKSLSLENFEDKKIKLLRPIYLPKGLYSNHIRIWTIFKKVVSNPPISITRFMCGYFFHFMFARHVWYYNYIKNNMLDSDYIFISDIRDVYFVKDIFKVLQFKGVRVHKELNTGDLKNCQINSKWLISLFGMERTTEILNNPVVCAGMIYGNRKSILQFYNHFFRIISKLTDVNEPCADQAVLNYLLAHESDLCEKMEVGVDGVWNISNFQSGDTFSIEDNQILINKNEVSVLHQYDRVSEIKNWVNTQ